jgi:hypothetical protein
VGCLVGSDLVWLASPVLQGGLRAGGFFVDPFVEACLFLEEIQLKDQDAKNAFFKQVWIASLWYFHQSKPQVILQSLPQFH